MDRYKPSKILFEIVKKYVDGEEVVLGNDPLTDRPCIFIYSPISLIKIFPVDKYEEVRRKVERLRLLSRVFGDIYKDIHDEIKEKLFILLV